MQDSAVDDTSFTCRHCAKAMSAVGDGFCCAGCRTAHDLIAACGLGDFYRQRSGPSPLQPPDDVAAAAVLGGQAVPRLRGDGLAEVDWYVEGLHCAACLWLLEHLPRLDSGVREARLAFARARLQVIYDPALTDPARQAALIAKLGYRARPFAAGTGQAEGERRDLLLRLGVSAASAVGAMHLALNLYAGELALDLDPAGQRFFALLSVVVALPAALYGAAPILRGARAALAIRRLSVDVSSAAVIVIGMVASFGSLLANGTAVYGDAVAMFVALLLAARLTVLTARERVADSAVAFARLLPQVARRGDGTLVAAVKIAPGETIMVASGEVLPCDGTVLGAAALVDASALSGESRPIVVPVGGVAYAGTVCRGDGVRLAVTATGSATRMGRLLADLGAAAERPARVTSLVDHVQGGFAVVVAIIAVATFAGWWWLAPAGGLVRGLDQAIAVVLVSCPCALGLATPLVQAVALARAAARGLLMRDAGVLDDLASGGADFRHAVFDKTGTLTTGTIQVVEWRWLADDAARPINDIRAAVAAAEARSVHPLAGAIVSHLADAGSAELSAWREIPGQGIEAVCDGHSLRVGSGSFTGVDAAGGLADGAVLSRVGVSWDGQPVAVLSCRDPIRTDASALLARLRSAGVQCHLLSGDDPQVTIAVGTALGFAATQVRGGCSPEAKAAEIVRLRADGHVLMVGDGLNDAQALAAADLGIGLRGGLEAAITSCRVFIARVDPLTAVGELIDGAVATRRRLRTLLTVSFAYNVVGIVLAVGGWWGPVICAIAMPLSSATVAVMAAAPGLFAAWFFVQPSPSRDLSSSRS